MLKIEQGANNQILRKKADKVKEITPEIKRLVLDMVKTIENDSNSIGLAAPQIGHSLRIIIVRPSLNEKPLVLINPEIKRKSFLKETVEEGCLSLPEFSVLVKRHKSITVEALNIDGQLMRIKTKGLLARIIQHEIDHLDGILICDYE